MATKPIPLMRRIQPLRLAASDTAVAQECGDLYTTASTGERSRSVPPRTIPEPWLNFPGDKYEIGKTLGLGGMGVVYEGVHRLTGRTVALKTLRSEYHTTPEAIERFVQEARVLAQIAGAGVVQLYDCAIGEQGVPYLVMERLNGVDLRDWLDRRAEKQLPGESVLRIALEIARVLARVHDRGIVHRDVKPENIFLSHNDQGRARVQLIDFGVAKLPSSRTRLTLVEHAVGSLLYISPEQLTDSRDVSPASDVWSIGMLMMELLRGTHPYPADLTDAQLICRILSDEPPKIPEQLPISVPLQAIVHRCLAKEPEQRYSDARALVQALIDCAKQVNWAKQGQVV